MSEIEYKNGEVGKLDMSGIGDLSIDVSAYGGAHVEDCINQMVGLATRMRIDVWCSLNGVRTLARPDDDAAALYAAWDRAVASPWHPYASTTRSAPRITPHND